MNSLIAIAILFTVGAVAWLLLSYLKHGGVSGLLCELAARKVRRAAKLRAMARWWDSFTAWAGPRYREFEAEELRGVE